MINIDSLFEDEKSNESVIEATSELNDGNDRLLNEAYESAGQKVLKKHLIPENLVPLTKNTPKEIKRNHLLAKIRLIEGKCGWTGAFKKRMSDAFFPIEEWPSFAIELLFTKHFGYGERISLACFLHGNGLSDKDIALTIVKLI